MIHTVEDKKKKKYIQFNIVKIYRTLYPNLLE